MSYIGNSISDERANPPIEIYCQRLRIDKCREIIL